MQVEVKLDTAATEPKVIILTNRMTEEVHSLVQMLSDTEPKLIAGFREDTVTVLDEKDILNPLTTPSSYTYKLSSSDS